MAYERQHRHDEQLQFAVFTRAFTVLHDIGWSRYSFGTGLAFLAWGGRGAGLDDWRIVAGAIALGWSWASPVAWRLRSALK
jgi:hypothetical protein